MLRAAQTDPLGAEVPGPHGVFGRVGIRPDTQSTAAVCVLQQPVDRADQVGGLFVDVGGGGVESLFEVGLHRRRHHRHLPDEHVTGRTVDAQQIAFRQHVPINGDGLGRRVDQQRFGAADASLAHPPGDNGGMTGLSAAGGQHAVGGDHAFQVVGVGLLAYQQHLLAARRPGLGRRRVEDDPADRGAG